MPIWIKIDAAPDNSLIINSPLSLLYRNIWTPTNFLSLWTTLLAYYPAVQLSGKITTSIGLICNDVMHPSPGSRWLGNNGIVQLQGWQTMLLVSRQYTEPYDSRARWNRRCRFCPLEEVSIFWPGKHLLSHWDSNTDNCEKSHANTLFPSPSQDSESEYPAFLCVWNQVSSKNNRLVGRSHCTVQCQEPGDQRLLW